jgi:hypothetical protein
MYYPFFRGKQYELIAIRENVQLLRDSGFVPIIEPVKESLNGLERTLVEVEKVGAHAIVIVNPTFGDHSDDGAAIQELLDRKLAAFKSVSAGVLAKADTSVAQLETIVEKQGNREVSIVHCGCNEGGDLARSLQRFPNVGCHVFLEEACGKLYRRHFNNRRVLVRDGFQRRANRKHPRTEPFSDLHVTFREEGVDGFGDFLVVGDDFAETGGPAYAVAIHLTFIDGHKDDAMFIHHFVSDTTDTPTDPAGKFAEAVRKLVVEVKRDGTNVYETKAVKEFLDLHDRGHFPGLGYVKKLSMQHHMETLSQYLQAK